MAGAETSFLVEDFIDAITSQLDRVQDSLRIKAVNRPLTYALKDLSLELKVFVELDAQGRVRFRTSSPSEAGASVVHLGFTTITKPMIEENTVSLAATRSPSLAEAGLGEEEARRLERLGVTNVSQLQNLHKTTGAATVSRLASVSADRLRLALTTGKPRVDVVSTTPPPKSAPVMPTPKPKPNTGIVPPKLSVPPSGKLQIKGRNLLSGDGTPAIRLNNRPLSIAEAADDRLVVDIPHDAMSGALELTLPDGDVISYELEVAGDDWAPRGTV